MIKIITIKNIVILIFMIKIFQSDNLWLEIKLKLCLIIVQYLIKSKISKSNCSLCCLDAKISVPFIAGDSPHWLSSLRFFVIISIIITVVIIIIIIIIIIIAIIAIIFLTIIINIIFNRSAECFIIPLLKTNSIQDF